MLILLVRHAKPFVPFSLHNRLPDAALAGPHTAYWPKMPLAEAARGAALTFVPNVRDFVTNVNPV